MSEAEIDGALERFLQVLVREIRASTPEYLEAPFTVAEIYQSLVPYREHRDEIGVTLNADYEHTLLRLLAGEGEYLQLESGRALDEIRRELDSPNPDTSVYRDFAAAHVRLDAERAGEVAGAGAAAGEEPGGGGAEPRETGAAEAPGRKAAGSPEGRDPAFPWEASPEPGEAAAGEGPDVGHGGGGPEASGTPRPPAAEGARSGEASAEAPDGIAPPEECPGCGAALPRKSVVNYCPFCGVDVRLRPCPGCGEELRIDWRFCVVCGAEMGPSGSGGGA